MAGNYIRTKEYKEKMSKLFIEGTGLNQEKILNSLCR